MPKLRPRSGARPGPEKKRARARLLRRGLGIASFLVVAAAVAKMMSPRAVEVDAARATRGPLVVAIEESGVTRVTDRYTVSAPVAGGLQRQLLEPGDDVVEGQVVARVSPSLAPLLDERTRSEAEARLQASIAALGEARSLAARARAASELAARDLDRARALARAGSLPQQALEQADFSARMHEQELASAEFVVKVAAEQTRLARASAGLDVRGPQRERHVDVLSPVRGSVLRVHQKSAAVVQAGTALLEIGDPRKLEVVVDLLTTDAVHVRPGSDVMLEGWGGEHALLGEVRRVEPAAFTRASALGVDEQRVNVIVAITDPRASSVPLGDGYRVEARVELWRSASVLTVPEGAVFRRGDGWAAYRIEDGKSVLRSVRLGHRGDRDVEVVSGLSEGDLVAVHPGDRVRAGAKVAVRRGLAD